MAKRVKRQAKSRNFITKLGSKQQKRDDHKHDKSAFVSRYSKGFQSCLSDAYVELQGANFTSLFLIICYSLWAVLAR